MKDASVLNTVQCFIRLLNISWKTVRPYGADPARATSGANRSGRALQEVASTGHGGARMQFCAPAKNAGVLRAHPRWRQEGFNRQPALLPSLRPDRANRKASWRGAPQGEQGIAGDSNPVPLGLQKPARDLGPASIYLGHLDRVHASSRLRISFPSPHPSSLFLPRPDSRRNPASVDFVSLDEMPVWQILLSPAFADAPHLKWPTPSSDRFSGRKFLVGKSIEFLTDFLFWRFSHFLHFAGSGERKKRGVPRCRTLIVNKRPRLSFRDQCSGSRYGGQGLHLKLTTRV